jgi:hypothetical protein
MSIEPIIIERNGYKVVEPNPPGSVVDHEDLFTFVKLEAKTTGKTFITRSESDDEKYSIVENLNFSSLDLTTGTKKPFLTTNWTEIGGSQFNDNTGKDLEGFGITNIDIKIQGSYIPQITIDFVDIRGATLFEQGSCSPYGVFFHLPYPIFELTVKGYYGKPVKYFLNLTKFTTKFNSETGNFECRGEFIGWSYAFLADMLIGFIAAAPYMDGFNAKEKLINIYDNIFKNYKDNKLISDESNPYIIDGKPITITDFLKKIKDLKTLFTQVKSTNDFDELNSLNTLKNNHKEISQKTFDFIRDVIKDHPNIKQNNSTTLTDKKYRLVWDGQSTVVKKEELEKIKQYISDLNVRIGVIKDIQNQPSGLKLTSKDDIKETVDSNWTNIPIPTEEPTDTTLASTPYLDLGYIIKLNNEDLKIIDDTLKSKRSSFRETVNELVVGVLGIKPTVRNITTILTCNTEVFIELLLECAQKAEKYHTEQNTTGDFVENRKDINNKVYPWPTYYEQKDKRTVEKFPGDNVEYLGWYEVKFVEDFLLALTKLKQDFDEIAVDEKQGIPGFDFFYPISPLESKYFNDSEISYNSLNNDSSGNSITDIIRDRMFLYFHTITNEVNMTNIGTGLGYGPKQDSWKKNRFILTEDIIKKQAEIEALNLLNTITSKEALQRINQVINTDGFQTQLINTLVSTKKLSEFENINTLFDETKKLLTLDDEYYIYKPNNDYIKINGQEVYYNWYDTRNNKTNIFEIRDITELPSGFSLNKSENTEIDLKIVVGELINDFNKQQPPYNKDCFLLEEASNTLLLSKDEQFSALAKDENTKKLITTKFVRSDSTKNDEYTKPNSGSYILNQKYPGKSFLPIPEFPGLGILSKPSKIYEGGTTIDFIITSFTTGEGSTETDSASRDLDEVIQTTKEDTWNQWSYLSVFDNLIMTPLWVDNINSVRKALGVEELKSVDDYTNLAYLFLASCKPSPLITKNNIPTDGRKIQQQWEKVYPKTLDFFYKTPGVVKVPKLWVLGLGATLWRWKTFMGLNTTTKGNIITGITWRHPLFGEDPIGIDPLSQPGNAVGSNSFYRYNTFGTKNIITQNFISITNPENLLQKSIFKNTNNGSLQFDYFGLYNNILKKTIQSQNFKTPIWQDFKETITSKKRKGDKKVLSTDDLKDLDTSNEFTTITDVKNKTTFPHLWITPWQHFYTEYNKVDGKEPDESSLPQTINPRNLLILLKTKDAKEGHENIEYDGSFLGDNKWYISTQLLDKISTQTLGQGFTFNYGSLGGVKSSQHIEGRYGDLIALLPDFVKDSFVEKFENWVNNDWKNKWLKIIDPVNFNNDNPKLEQSYTTDIMGEKYIFDYVVPYAKNEKYINNLFPSSDSDAAYTNIVPNEKFNDLIKQLFDEHYYIINTRPDMWNLQLSDRKGFVGKKLFVDKYVEKFKDKFKDGYTKKLTELEKEKIEDNNLFGESALDDTDIKLSLYRSFRSITDKWISSSTDEKKFFNVTGEKEGGKPPRLLGEHFSFVTRTMKDIGDEAIIDPTAMLKVADNPKMSLYNLMVDVLKESNFDFFPLPTFSNFTNNNIQELTEMFKPITTFTPVKGGPNFICMYVGGTSKGLDIKPIENVNCPIDVTKKTNPNDGFNLSDDQDLPEEYSDIDGQITPSESDRIENAGFTAFRVSYGNENQNHFKSVQLDQSEFSETNESLVVIEQLSQGGDPSNRAFKGNNLHNVYLTRSYSCTVESLGNMQIQPLQYFELTNIPMFRGSYLITEVSHNIKPHYVGTTFKGTRQPLTTVPIVTDVLSVMNLSFNDAESSSGSKGNLSNLGVKKASNKTTTSSTNYVNRYKVDLKTFDFKPNVDTILGSVLPQQKENNPITVRALQEISNWDNGSKKESVNESVIQKYIDTTGLKSFTANSYATDKTPWSSLFVSYIMLAGDSNFPVTTQHKEYVDKAMRGENGYEVFTLEGDIKIKPEIGDILLYPRSGAETNSHGDIIYKIENNTIYLIGGNISNTILNKNINLPTGFLTKDNRGNYEILIKKTNNKYYNKQDLRGYASDNPTPGITGGRSETKAKKYDDKSFYTRIGKIS